MRTRCIQFLVAVFLSSTLAVLSRGETVDLQFKEATWFPDEIATALVFLSVEEAPSVELPESNDEIRFYGNEVIALQDDKRGRFAVVVEFVPRRAGVRMFPALTMSSGERVFETRPQQFIVSEIVRSKQMSLTIQPAKQEVYQGEPLRIDFTWSSELPVGQMRALRLAPTFFNDSNIKVSVPRSQVDSDAQFGMPVGGRRVIAERIRGAEKGNDALGEVRFSVWVKFEKAGRVAFPETRLLCSMLEDKGYGSHQYAAYFNNSLFEAVDRSKPYKKLEVRSEAFAIEVLPLKAEGRLESFSGLFSPEAIEVSVTPLDLELGQLMEIRVDVKSEACSEMLQLPSLALQRSLRHRFWVAEEMGETWQTDGRRFVARARPLTVETRYFPSLSFQVFDVESGNYRTIDTASIPLDIARKEGMSYFSVENLPGAKRVVEVRSQGVWHNENGSFMKDLAHVLITFLADGVVFFLLLGPLLFFVLSPWVRELRRRVVDKAYGRRRAAFALFKRDLASGGDAGEALRRLVADCFERPVSTLTAQDAGELLRAHGCDAEFADEVEQVFRERETEIYSVDGERAAGAESPERIKVATMGKRLYQTVNKVLTVFLLVAAFASVPDAEAGSFETAEKSFAAALDLAETGMVSGRIEEAFAEAALGFEASAEEGTRPGVSWYNAGNAWFKAGEIGRAIAAYRRAEAYRPFDEKLQENLAASRALRVDAFAGSELEGPKWPVRWVLAGVSVFWIASWGMLLCWRRYESRGLLVLSGLCFLVAIGLGGVALRDQFSSEREGVLVAAEAFGRKGPGFAYQSAFGEPLHSGLELRVVEVREGWIRASLSDGTECWLPRDAVVEL